MGIQGELGICAYHKGLATNNLFLEDILHLPAEHSLVFLDHITNRLQLILSVGLIGCIDGLNHLTQRCAVLRAFDQSTVR